MKNWMAEFSRALRNFRYERSPAGIYFPAQDAMCGGVFSTQEEGGEWVRHKNTVTLEYLDKILSDWFNGGAAPTGFYIAPFINNVAPTSALTAATFAGTQGEYIDYTETGRVPWVSNGIAVSQKVSNSNAVAEFTIGAAAATIRGAGLLTAPDKGATTGVLVAAALFSTANTLNAGSTLKIKYELTLVPSA